MRPDSVLFHPSGPLQDHSLFNESEPLVLVIYADTVAISKSTLYKPNKAIRIITEFPYQKQGDHAL